MVLSHLISIVKKIGGNRKTKTVSISEYEISLIESLLDRAVVCGIDQGEYHRQWMDLVSAHQQFTLDLEELLLANDQDFICDFTGIQKHMNHSSNRIEDGYVPKYVLKKTDVH